MRTANLYKTSPYPVLGRGEKSLSNIPLKKADPWSSLIVNEYAPENVASNPDAGSYDYGDNLRIISEQLQKEYPSAHSKAQQFSSAVTGFGAPGRHQLLTKAKLPVTQGFAQVRDQNPTVPETMWDTAFIPTPEQMQDPSTAGNFSPGRQFGALAHEARHIIGNNLSPEFHHADDQVGKDMFGNQRDHFPGPYTDRDMANDMKILDLSHSQPIPQHIRTRSPWMGSKQNPTIDDLMKYIGTQPGYRKP